MNPAPESRRERKERTRAAILQAALSLSGETGLAGLSLRSVAKEVGIVPTAFYRHFESIENLGLALVDESFVSLRAMLREARAEWSDIDAVIDNSVDVLARHVRAHRGHFGFIFRERMSGVESVRAGIRHELELFERELATDLARLPDLNAWSSEDLRVYANLIVAVMVNVSEALMTAPRLEAEDAITRTAQKQINMLIVGAANWRSV